MTGGLNSSGLTNLTGIRSGDRSKPRIALTPNFKYGLPLLCCCCCCWSICGGSSPLVVVAITSNIIARSRSVILTNPCKCPIPSEGCRVYNYHKYIEIKEGSDLLFRSAIGGASHSIHMEAELKRSTHTSRWTRRRKNEQQHSGDSLSYSSKQQEPMDIEIFLQQHT